MSRLLRGQVAQLLLVEAHGDGRALQRRCCCVASAETVTVSATAPSSSFASTRATPPVRTTTPVCSNFLKLVVTTSTR